MPSSRVARFIAGTAIAALVLIGAVSTPATAASPDVQVSGQVLLAPAYTPAPAGTVSVTWESVASGPESTPVLVDADGRYTFSLAPGSYYFRYAYVGADGDYAELTFTRRGFATPVVVTDSPVTVPTQTMYLRGSVNGQVLLGAGAKVPAGAGQVRVLPYVSTIGTNPVPQPDKAVYTDAAGRFSVVGLTLGQSYSFDVTWTGGDAAAYRMTTFYTSIVAADGFAVVHSQTLLKLGSVSGHVSVGDAAHPAPGGAVRVTATSVGPCTIDCVKSALTGADGSYTIADVPEGRWTVGFASTATDEYTPVTLPTFDGSGPVTDLDATLQPTPRISGTITDSAGAPVVHTEVIVSAFDPTEPGREAWTDADGHYVVKGLVAGHSYTAAAFDMSSSASWGWPNSSWPTPQTITLGAGEARSGVDIVVYEPAYGVGSISLLGADSHTEADGHLEVSMLDKATGRWRTVADPGESILGDWNTPPLPPGTYRFRVAMDGVFGAATVTSSVFTLAEGGRATFSPRLRPYQRDFTGDRHPDILVRNAAGQLLTYPSNGNGGFLAPRVVGTGFNSLSLLYNSGAFEGPYEDSIVGRDSQGVLNLYLDYGGHFLSSDLIGTGWNSMNLIFSPGDFDGDGATDVLARDAGGNLWLYRGDGTRGWRGAPIRVGTGWSSYTVFAAGDMNEDGYPDIVGRDASGALWLYPGNGSHGWKPRVRLGVGWGTLTGLLSVGDFDGDDSSDIIARDSAGKLWLYPGTGTGALGPRRQIGSGWNGLTFVN